MTNDSTNLLHIGIHNSLNRNAGDTLLFQCVRSAFNHFMGPTKFELRQVWEKFDTQDAKQLNQAINTKAIIIGGGGLLLKNQQGADASASGWQWNCDAESINLIEKPIIVFAIGYNRFRGQDDFEPIFHDNINTLVDKSHFCGLRNTGSIQSLIPYLKTDELKGKLHLQPCPTTILWQLSYDELKQKKKYPKNEKKLVLNCAFDREEHRFPNGTELYLEKIADSMKYAENKGWSIVCVHHKDQDKRIEANLKSSSVTFESHNLTDSSAEEIVNFYNNVDLVIGMRGHAQMIPFGLRKPIVSIISHEKMKYFLDDIKHPEWGVDIKSSTLKDELIEKIDALSSDRYQTIQEQVNRAQQAQYNLTKANFDTIRKIIK